MFTAAAPDPELLNFGVDYLLEGAFFFFFGPKFHLGSGKDAYVKVNLTELSLNQQFLACFMLSMC